MVELHQVEEQELLEDKIAVVPKMWRWCNLQAPDPFPNQLHLDIELEANVDLPQEVLVVEVRLVKV